MEQKLSQRELSSRLAKASKQVTVGAEYMHYKNKSYKVINLAILEANNEICVVYQAQYGDKLIFIRPIADWIKEVEWQGKRLKRFTKI